LEIIGADRFNTITMTVRASRVSNGRVSMRLWSIDDNEKISRYSGNEIIEEFKIYILNSAYNVFISILAA